jgi:hypothetical protein
MPGMWGNQDIIQAIRGILRQVMSSKDITILRILQHSLFFRFVRVDHDLATLANEIEETGCKIFFSVRMADSNNRRQNFAGFLSDTSRRMRKPAATVVRYDEKPESNPGSHHHRWSHEKVKNF